MFIIFCDKWRNFSSAINCVIVTLAPQAERAGNETRISSSVSKNKKAPAHVAWAGWNILGRSLLGISQYFVGHSFRFNPSQDEGEAFAMAMKNTFKDWTSLIFRQFFHASSIIEIPARLGLLGAHTNTLDRPVSREQANQPGDVYFLAVN